MKRRIGIVVASLAMVSAACGSTSGSPTNDWIKATGLGGTIASLQRTSATAQRLMNDSAATSNERYTVCSVLLLGAQQGNGDLPAPDSTLSKILAEAYSELGTAATACAERTIGAATASRFERSRRLAMERLAEAKARAEALVGGRLSTSTTRPGDPTSAS